VAAFGPVGVYVEQAAFLVAADRVGGDAEVVGDLSDLV
jgi:hypothetical protein